MTLSICTVVMVSLLGSAEYRFAPVCVGACQNIGARLVSGEVGGWVGVGWWDLELTTGWRQLW